MKTLSPTQSQRAFSLFKPKFASKLLIELGQTQQRSLTGNLKASGMSARALKSPNRLFRDTQTGKFKGLPKVVLNGFYPDRTPKFIFEKNSSAPFSFTDSTGRKFTPKKMETDGGSIPRLLHGNASFSPWGYGLGYIIHDWVFIAHKCKSKPDDDLSFDDSCRLMAETIKTLMTVGFTDYDNNKIKYPVKKLDLYWIHTAVCSSIARKLWNKDPTIKCRS